MEFDRKTPIHKNLSSSYVNQSLTRMITEEERKWLEAVINKKNYSRNGAFS
jgi:hypothetical protein